MHFPQQYAHPQPVQHRKGKERKKVFVSFQVEFIPFKTHKTEINLKKLVLLLLLLFNNHHRTQ